IIYIEKKQGSKQKYGFGISYAKKALNNVIQADKVNEFVNYLERFIKTMKDDLDKQQKNANDIKNLAIDDPIHVWHKGRQPNYYKSEGEGSSKKKA
ncbi:1549_t:CDS:1, partial [Racocetra fulgida]